MRILLDISSLFYLESLSLFSFIKASSSSSSSMSPAFLFYPLFITSNSSSSSFFIFSVSYFSIFQKSLVVKTPPSFLFYLFDSCFYFFSLLAVKVRSKNSSSSKVSFYFTLFFSLDDLFCYWPKILTWIHSSVFSRAYEASTYLLSSFYFFSLSFSSSPNSLLYLWTNSFNSASTSSYRRRLF